MLVSTLMKLLLLRLLKVCDTSAHCVWSTYGGNCYIAGFIDDSAIQELLSECAKMKNFANLHVMSLKGVCLDGGPVPYIVLPYMANGSLASYLKKERKNLIMMNDSSCNDDEPQSQVCFITIIVIKCSHYSWA